MSLLKSSLVLGIGCSFMFALIRGISIILLLLSKPGYILIVYVSSQSSSMLDIVNLLQGYYS